MTIWTALPFVAAFLATSGSPEMRPAAMTALGFFIGLPLGIVALVLALDLVRLAQDGLVARRRAAHPRPRELDEALARLSRLLAETSVPLSADEQLERERLRSAHARLAELRREFAGQLPAVHSDLAREAALAESLVEVHELLSGKLTALDSRLLEAQLDKARRANSKRQ